MLRVMLSADGIRDLRIFTASRLLSGILLLSEVTRPSGPDELMLELKEVVVAGDLVVVEDEVLVVAE